MNAIRRLVFLLGILPVAVYLFVRWIFTGADIVDAWIKYEDWGTR